MRHKFLIAILFFIVFNAKSQYFSFARLAIKSTEFSDEKFKNERLKLLKLTSFASQEKIVSNSGNLPSENDEINLDILNIIISYSKHGEEMKTLSKINEIDNKLNGEGISKSTKANFCFLKFNIYSNYNLYIDTTNFQSCYTALNDLQKYTFLYSTYYLSNPTTNFIRKVKNDEFITVASKVSSYDLVKAISLQVNRKALDWDKEKINKLLIIRDSTLDYVIRKEYKNGFNPNIEYLPFSSQNDFVEQINIEKIISLNDLGFISREKKDLNQSVKWFKQAIKLNDKQSIKIIEPELYSNLGLTLTLEKEFDVAEYNYNRALKIYESVNDKKKIAEVLNIIGKNNFLNSKNQTAINTCNQSLQISTQNQDYKNISESYLLLSDIYSSEGDFFESNKYYKLYIENKKNYSDWIQKNESNRLISKSNYESINQDVIEDFQKKEQEKIELLKVKLESNQKEKDLIVLKKEAELREASLLYNKLEEEKSKQELILSEEKLKNQKKELANLERQNKINSLQVSWAKNNLDLALNKNRILDQDKIINDLKVHEIKQDKNSLLYDLAGLAILIILLIFLLIKNGKHSKAMHKQNFKLSKKNEEISEQRNTILKKNEEIIDSIHYALKIQTALLPTEEEFKRAFSNSYIFYKPKDIVSGDFYWKYESADFIFYATADCTGHGVPGGFMSMLGISLLNDIVKDKKITDPCDVLDLMSVKIISELKQTEKIGKSKDGMDITLCRLNKTKTELVFASANNDLWLIRNGQIIEFKADRQPVGYHFGPITQFNQQKIDLLSEDIIITFSDGYSDQFGGEKGKKYKYRQLQQLLLTNSNLSMDEQKLILHETIENWRGDLEQVDDILVIGIRV